MKRRQSETGCDIGKRRASQYAVYTKLWTSTQLLEYKVGKLSMLNCFSVVIPESAVSVKLGNYSENITQALGKLVGQSIY